MNNTICKARFKPVPNVRKLEATCLVLLFSLPNSTLASQIRNKEKSSVTPPRLEPGTLLFASNALTNWATVWLLSAVMANSLSFCDQSISGLHHTGNSHHSWRPSAIRLISWGAHQTMSTVSKHKLQSQNFKFDFTEIFTHTCLVLLFSLWNSTLASQIRKKEKSSVTPSRLEPRTLLFASNKCKKNGVSCQ